VAFSFHKMCGPSGMGALWGRADRLALLEPFLVGGDTVADVWQDRVEYRAPPRRFEAGLQDYAGMLGAEAAVSYVTGTVGLDAIEAHERALGRYLYERLSPLEGEHLWILGPRDPARRSGILTLGASTGALVNAIARRADEEHNVMVRRGMFCANAYLHRRFDASGHAHDHLRASVYLYNTEDECEVFCRVVERVARDPLAFLDDA
jgi:cysteine desulfurase/selenocysteine lyase